MRYFTSFTIPVGLLPKPRQAWNFITASAWRDGFYVPGEVAYDSVPYTPEFDQDQMVSVS